MKASFLVGTLVGVVCGVPVCEPVVAQAGEIEALKSRLPALEAMGHGAPSRASVQLIRVVGVPALALVTLLGLLAHRRIRNGGVR